MKLTPKHTVSYKGVFHPAGQSFEIDPQDSSELSQYGTIIESEQPEATETAKKAPRAAGRAKKN